ncbi:MULTISPECIES: DUF397 domain-containing protein [Nocardiopsidaceae]|uniref:DUF397 domain-containing protein n=2 Tax=Nocardiopsidaceae TaxID=83676 RepID=A0ABY6YLS6_9ACTN|nr:DUF397 domain-containing protein [Streptomonospora nanhaiensis]MEE2042909.1 DUF397 domain-containing protein [Nocardiopsis tropica]WAE73155.1 DUF397 domain-containing protein [Streptomonospora nanhaiensis]
MAASTPHLMFRKSSYSGARTENCVEFADVGEGTAVVRDSQNPADGHFLLSGREWGALLGAVRHG